MSAYERTCSKKPSHLTWAEASVGERMFFFTEEYLDELHAQEEFFRLPVSISSVKLTNIGPITNAIWKLRPGLNIVEGPGGSGKTYACRSIAWVFGLCDGRDLFPRRSERKCKIEVEIGSESKIVCTVPGPQTPKSASMLLDDPMGRLSLDMHERFLKLMMKRADQVIVFQKMRGETYKGLKPNLILIDIECP